MGKRFESGQYPQYFGNIAYEMIFESCVMDKRYINANIILFFIYVDKYVPSKLLQF